MTERKLQKDDCLLLLVSKGEELLARGADRLPRRADFADDEVVAIKAFLGPWPRALEAAGLKEPRSEDRLEKNREKRRRARRRARKARQSEGASEADGDV